MRPLTKAGGRDVWGFVVMIESVNDLGEILESTHDDE